MIQLGTFVQHNKHGWRGRVVDIQMNCAEDGILWCEVECKDGSRRLAPIDELTLIEAAAAEGRA